jgi:hypothetical protein
LPALLAKIDAAATDGQDTVKIWSSARPRREFVDVDDLAERWPFLMKTWSDEEPINIGTGTDITIAEFTGLIANVVGFSGRFMFDAPSFLEAEIDYLRIYGHSIGKSTYDIPFYSWDCLVFIVKRPVIISFLEPVLRNGCMSVPYGERNGVELFTWIVRLDFFRGCSGRTPGRLGDGR